MIITVGIVLKQSSQPHSNFAPDMDQLAQGGIQYATTISGWML